MVEGKITRCKQCRTLAEPRDGRCPVCGIKPDKKHSDLSRPEKKVRIHAHAIRVVAMCHLILAAMLILMLPELPSRGPVMVLVVINALLAIGLSRYSLSAYRAGVVFYFLIGMVNVVSVQRDPLQHLCGIALALLALYLVGNGTSKALFERKPPEL